jgi:hypothetical protein
MRGFNFPRDLLGTIIQRLISMTPFLPHDCFSPLATDTTICIVIVLVLSLHFANLQHNWVIEMIDVEAAFLNAEVDQDIFIEIPEGLSSPSTSESEMLSLVFLKLFFNFIHSL